ncbi:MAG: hypothetical protein EOP61_33270, partial [Sphingomonadales bacterium]
MFRSFRPQDRSCVRALPRDIAQGIIVDVVTILLRRVNEMSADFIGLLPQLSIAVIVLIMTFIGAKFARRLADRLLAGVTPANILAVLGLGSV